MSFHGKPRENIRLGFFSSDFLIKKRMKWAILSCLISCSGEEFSTPSAEAAFGKVDGLFARKSHFRIASEGSS